MGLMRLTQIPKFSQIWNSQAHQRVVLNNSDGPKLAVKTMEIIHEVLCCKVIKKYLIFWKMFWKILGIVGRSELISIWCLDVISVLHVGHQLITETDLLCLSSSPGH